MSEPISGGVAVGAAAFKAAGGSAAGGLAAVAAGGGGLAAVVVMLLMRPRTRGEWAVALISTVVSSVAGGAAVVQHYGLQSWAQDYIGLVALFGLVFGCGLPGWAVVRWLFNFIERRRDKDLADIVREVKQEVGP